MNDLNHTNRHQPLEPRGLWETWSRGQILGLAVLLMAGNFFFQILFYTVHQELFIPVLAGAVAGVLLPVVLITHRWNYSLGSDFGLWLPPPLTLAASALMAVCSLMPTSLLAELSMRLHPADPEWESFFSAHLPTTGTEILLAAVTVVIAAPLAEEIIFRGLLHRLTSSLWGAAPAAVISALLFAIVHGEPWFLFGLIGVGLMLAFIFETTGSVTACWVAHGVHNSISLWAMLHHEGDLAEPQGVTGQDWTLAGVSVLGILVIGRFMLMGGKNRPT